MAITGMIRGTAQEVLREEARRAADDPLPFLPFEADIRLRLMCTGHAQSEVE
jgi:hypothetical protein